MRQRKLWTDFDKLNTGKGNYLPIPVWVLNWVEMLAGGQGHSYYPMLGASIAKRLNPDRIRFCEMGKRIKAPLGPVGQPAEASAIVTFLSIIYSRAGP